MIERKVTLSGLDGFISELTTILQSTNKPQRVVIKEWREQRSIPQNALQHSIYGAISKYLIANGRVDWTPDKVKLSLKSKFLGWRVECITDVSTGEIIKKEMLRETKKLDTGESYHYTTQIIEWAESIGCEIRIPVKCEYRELMEKQNG